MLDQETVFDVKDPNVMAITTNYMMNEFLSESDHALFEQMKKNPRRYRVAGLGDWGVVDGLVYDSYEEGYSTLMRFGSGKA